MPFRKEKNMKIVVSPRALRLNEDDHIDFDAMAESAVANGGDSYCFIYHAHVDNDTVYITTSSED